MAHVQKFYCYVDETGQDPSAAFFVVVAVVSDQEQNRLRQELTDVESLARTGQRKWHKSRPDRRIKYLRAVLQKQIGAGDVFFGKYQKPLPYFLPILETIEKAITKQVEGEYRATVFVDGIDRKKAAELTNALRLRGIRLAMVKSRRDESEPLIRLADMWAGCIRAATFGDTGAKELFEVALRDHYLIELAA